MTLRVWFDRTIRAGRVRIAGRTYVPDERHLAYDGRMDGMRVRFARYVRPELQPYIFMWGPTGKDRRKRHHVVEDAGGTHWLPWTFWNEAPDEALAREEARGV